MGQDSADSLRPGAHPAVELSPSTRELVELVAERVDAATGPVRLEFELEAGRVQRWWLHRGPFGATALAGYDQ
jgi:hypothetical protein